jgi:phage baseplate assembly protein W
MHGFEVASIAAGVLAAACWFWSARVRLTKVGFGQDQLGSGLIDYSQQMTMAAMQIADMNV